jgi:hypothetical protein
MTKVWSIEVDYPQSRMADYDEVASGLARNDLQPLNSRIDRDLLHFALSTKVDPAKISAEYGVLWSNILAPLANGEIASMIAAEASEWGVQFIPAIIKVGEKSLKDYVLLNPTKKVDAVDQGQSIPRVFKVPGFPDARMGYERMVLRSDFPEWGIGRQHDAPSQIVVGAKLAAAVMARTKKGVRFTS